jgi:hypothetical protein
MADVMAMLRERYGIEGSQARDLGGSSCLNLLVADGPARYVVRVYRPCVTAGRLAAIQLVRRTLERATLKTSPKSQTAPRRRASPRSP